MGGQKEHRMSKEIYISSTPHETRLAIVENDALTEIYYERENEYTLAGSIYNGKVTRVLPGMQSSFVDIGLERDAFLYITDFMEEAGDSADFDTNGDSNRRSEGRRNGSAPTLEGTIASPSEDVTDSASRSDRNGRGGRGRGRRDRSGNRDRQPLSDTAAPVDSQNQDAPDFNRPVDFAPENAPIVRTDESDLGEGAPGADGTRRWRGRRGRRRGRGPGQREESPQIAGAPTTGSVNEVSYGDDSFDVDIDGAAAVPSTDTAPIASAYSTTEAASPTRENTGRNDRNNRGGRDRNDRNRGRGDRGGRDNRESRVPRGFAPKTSLYGVDDAPAYNESPELDAGAGPIILPGESLSKYRRDSETTAAASAKPADASIIVPAAPEFTIPSGWDGGATLPGESLSRHRRTENRQDTRTEYRQDSRENYRNDRESEPRSRIVSEENPASIAETTEKRPDPELSTHSETGPPSSGRVRAHHRIRLLPRRPCSSQRVSP